mgnify:CR=1 FL=1
MEEKNGIMVLAGILLVSILFACTTETFAATANFLRLLRQMVIMVIIATGMTFVVATGEMDISVGAIYNLTVNIMALLILHTGMSPWLCAPIGILAGVACGVINGVASVSLDCRQSSLHWVLLISIEAPRWC